ncbi:MAG: hypothetical protein ABI847_10775 [Anaerolineales bacterium]
MPMLDLRSQSKRRSPDELMARCNPYQARGWLEAYLIRARAAHPEKLPPMPKLR